MFRLALLATTFVVAASSADAAAYLYTTVPSEFAAYVGASAINTTSTLGNLGDPITSVKLSNGVTIGLSGAADIIDQPGVGVGPFGNGYTGQVVDSTTNTETLTFSAPLSAFGVTLLPDIPIVPSSTSVTLSFTLDSGNGGSFTNVYGPTQTLFFGYAGAPIRSLTLTTSTPDFSFGQFLTVPEPTTALLLGTTLIPLLRRRRAA